MYLEKLSVRRVMHCPFYVWVNPKQKKTITLFPHVSIIVKRNTALPIHPPSLPFFLPSLISSEIVSKKNQRSAFPNFLPALNECIHARNYKEGICYFAPVEFKKLKTKRGFSGTQQNCLFNNRCGPSNPFLI